MEQKPTPDVQSEAIPSFQELEDTSQFASGNNMHAPLVNTSYNPNIQQQLATKPKSPGWQILFTILAVLEGLGLALLLAGIIYGFISGGLGGLVIILLVFFELAPILGAVSFINLVGLIIYLVRRKPHGKALVLSIISMLISLPFVLYGVYGLYAMATQFSISQDDMRKVSQQSETYRHQVVAENAKPETTVEEATTLMESCEVDFLVGYTGDVSVVKDVNSQGWLTSAELSPTGIKVSDTGAKTYIFTSKAMTAELPTIARLYRQSCYGTKKLYIAIDDTIETEYPVGTWTTVKQ